MKLDIIYNEDCIGKKGMCILPDRSIDMILCDLPYGTTACKWDTIIPLEPLWKEYKRIIKDNGAIVLTANQPFTSKLVMSNIKMFKCSWIWQKTKATNYVKARQMPMKYHEDILVFGKKKIIYNPQMQIGKPYTKKAISIAKDNAIFVDTRKIGDININSGTRFPSTIQIFSNDNHNSLHPTQKPIALFEYLIKTYTNEGNIVLDNCIGSGTTAVACVHLKRHYIGFDTSKKYCRIAKARLEAEKTLWD